MGPVEAFDSAVGLGAQSTLRRQPSLREGGKLHMSTKSRRNLDTATLISCLAPRARDLAGGLVRSPVQLLARPAAVLYALTRTALVVGAIRAARARAAAALALARQRRALLQERLRELFGRAVRRAYHDRARPAEVNLRLGPLPLERQRRGKARGQQQHQQRDQRASGARARRSGSSCCQCAAAPPEPRRRSTTLAS